MVVIGVLAAIAVPAFLSNKAKAQETAVKSDVKQITKEVVAFYVDGTGPLTVQNSADGRSWSLLDDTGAEVATGPLSQRNAVVTSGVITSDSVYCIAVQPQDARAWRVTVDGFAARPLLSRRGRAATAGLNACPGPAERGQDTGPGAGGRPCGRSTPRASTTA